MLNRERFVLAVLDELTKKPPVSKLQLHKLIFLFAKELPPKFSFYGFFPHKLGPWSYKLEHDLTYFQQHGFLDEGLKTTSKGTTEMKMLPVQKRFLTEIDSKFAVLSQLVDYVYQKYPEYTIRSQAKNIKILVPKPPSTPMIFLIGYENRLVDDMVNLLIQKGITILIDVRNNPVSMNYDFNRTNLEKIMHIAEIQYLNWKELGVPSKIRKQFKTENNDQILKYYKDAILPERMQKIEELVQLGKIQRIALMCYERNYHQCHRGIIGEILGQKNCEVQIIE